MVILSGRGLSSKLEITVRGGDNDLEMAQRCKRQHPSLGDPMV